MVLTCAGLKHLSALLWLCCMKPPASAAAEVSRQTSSYWGGAQNRPKSPVSLKKTLIHFYRKKKRKKLLHINLKWEQLSSRCHGNAAPCLDIYQATSWFLSLVCIGKRLILADVSFHGLSLLYQKVYLFISLIYVYRGWSRSVFFILQSQINVLTHEKLGV